MADVQDHGAMTRDERRECGFAGGIARGGESLKELTVR